MVCALMLGTGSFRIAAQAIPGPKTDLVTLAPTDRGPFGPDAAFRIVVGTCTTTLNFLDLRVLMSGSGIALRLGLGSGWRPDAVADATRLLL